jgi:hypothetical protein
LREKLIITPEWVADGDNPKAGLVLHASPSEGGS